MKKEILEKITKKIIEEKNNQPHEEYIELIDENTRLDLEAFAEEIQEYPKEKVEELISHTYVKLLNIATFGLSTPNEGITLKGYVHMMLNTILKLKLLMELYPGYNESLINMHSNVVSGKYTGSNADGNVHIYFKAKTNSALADKMFKILKNIEEFMRP